MAKARKTISEKIMTATERRGEFTPRVARQYFSKLNADQIHNSVMRCARQLATDGILERVAPGTYQIA
jgi:predicted transcriptional regulator of viral defense system